MPNEPLSPRPIRLSQKLRDLSRLRYRGIEDKGKTEEFHMVHTPDRPHRIITPVEAPSEEECGDTISSWHKAVKNDSEEEEEEEKLRPARSYWKAPNYTGGHPGQHQPQHHEPHARGHLHIYTPSGLSQEVHVDSFQGRSRDVRRSASEQNRRTFSESPVPRPLVPDKSKQRQKHLHHTPLPLVKQSMERDIPRGRGRGKGDQPKSGGAATYSLPREYKIKAMELPRQGQCPYCRCQLGNRTYLTCPNPPCGKGLTTFEGSWIAPPKLKDRRPASPSIFGAIGRQLLGRPLKSSPDSIGSLPSQQKRLGTNTLEALTTLPESIAPVGIQCYRTPPPPPTSTSRQTQRAKSSSPAGTTWSSFAQLQGKQAPDRRVVGFERERKRLPPPVHIQQHPRFEHITSPPYCSSGFSSGASTPTPSHSSSAAPLRSAPPQITLPLRTAPPSQLLRSAPPPQTLRAPASLNNLQPLNKQPLVSKFSTSQLQPYPPPQRQPSPQKYPDNHIASALSSSLPSSQPPPTTTSKSEPPDYLGWIPPSEHSLFYPHSPYYTSPPPPPSKKSSRPFQSQHAYPPQQPQAGPPLQSHFEQQPNNPPSENSDTHFRQQSSDTHSTTHSSQASDYLNDIYSHYGHDPNSSSDYDTDDTTKPPPIIKKQKSWTSSKYSTDTASTTSTTHSLEKGGDETTDDDGDDDKWNQLDGSTSEIETPTRLRPTPPPFGGGSEQAQGKNQGLEKRPGKLGGNYKTQASNKGLRVATGKEDKTGREGPKERLARELEVRRMKWL